MIYWQPDSLAASEQKTHGEVGVFIIIIIIKLHPLNSQSLAH